MVLGVLLTPGPGSSLGMPLIFFVPTYGLMTACALFAFCSYCECRACREPLSAFYLVCPIALMCVLIFVCNLQDVVRMILRYEGTP